MSKSLKSAMHPSLGVMRDWFHMSVFHKCLTSKNWHGFKEKFPELFLIDTNISKTTPESESGTIVYLCK